MNAERFDDAVVTGVVAHMNGDHLDDSIDIVRAYGQPEATAAQMIDLDTEEGVWIALVEGKDREVRVPWPGAPLSERPQLRVAVVELHTAAREKLGLGPVTPH